MSQLERLTLSVAEAAQVLGISRSSAYAAVHAGTIPTVHIAGRLLVPKAALNALLPALPATSPSRRRGEPRPLSSGCANHRRVGWRRS